MSSDTFQVGFRYSGGTVIREYSDQAKWLKASGIDPSFYGNYAEIGLYGMDSFRAMTKAGMSFDVGNLLLQMRYRQTEAIYLDQPLLIQGWVETVSSTSIGSIIHHIVEFHRPTGERPLINDITFAVISEKLAKPRPQKPSNKAEAKTDPAEGFKLIQKKRLTPQNVKIFSQGDGNKMHLDPEFVARYGFQAPLAQGVMSVVWLISALVRQEIPKEMDIDIHFIRPVFWDDEAWLWGKPDATGRHPYEVVRTTNAANKVTAEMLINHIGY